ncbi:MAG TPA: NAD-dependent epimerase/dehydratase family protein [Polyangia bacterium]|nr:NAD-dependent epimerase/dehydratase family protein [Polyangia bacterium]
MKVAVTGAAGQLGTVVLRRLAVERGVTALRSLDLRPPAVASGKLEHLRADVRDPELGRFLEGCDALVHLAFIVTGAPPRPVFDAINVGGSKNVIEAAVRAGIKKIVYTSSVAAYGVVHGHPRPIVEETPRVHQPAFPYSAAKWEVEAWLDEFEPRHADVAIARLRPSIVIGAPTVHAHGAMLARRAIVDVEAPLPLVWDEDVAEAVALALRKSARGAFNVTAEPAATARELAKACDLRLVRVPKALIAGVAQLGALANKLGLSDALDPAWLRLTDVCMEMSAEKARRELGWKPKCPTPESVVKRFLAENSTGLDRRLDVFVRLLQLASRRAIDDPSMHTRGRVHLRLTGPGGGDVGFIIDGPKVEIIREMPRPPTTVVTMKTATFYDLLGGRTDFNTGQLTGKVRVEGEALNAFVIAAIITRFRSDAPKRLQKLLVKGA